MLLHFVLKSLGNHEESDLKDEESRTEGDKTENVLTATPPTDDLATSDGGMGTTDDLSPWLLLHKMN